MQQEFLLTAFLLAAMALLAGAALVLSFLHWKEWRERGSGPVYLGKAKPLDRLLRDHPSQRKADAGFCIRRPTSEGGYK